MWSNGSRRSRRTLQRDSRSLQIQQKLQKDLASQFSEAQRRAYLREQMKAIQRELGEGDTGTEAVQLRTRLEAAHPPAEVMAQAEREMKRLDLIPPASPRVLRHCQLCRNAG